MRVAASQARVAKNKNDYANLAARQELRHRSVQYEACYKLSQKGKRNVYHYRHGSRARSKNLQPEGRKMNAAKPPRTKRLAKKALRIYRLYRRMGYTPAQARANAHFAIMCKSGGRKNLYAENLLKRYKNYSPKGAK